MAQVHRMVCEYKSQRVYPTLSGDEIENGDLLVADASGNARPVSSVATADAVADAFIGLAMLGSPSGHSPDIVVATDVVADMDFASALPAVQPVGAKVEAYIVGGAAVDQSVVIGATNPIGKLYRRAAVGDTLARVHLVGKDMEDIPVAD